MNKFWSKVQESAPDKCWEWNGTKDRLGYGHFYCTDKRRMVLAHRYAYEQRIGSIPLGMDLDHLCRNRGCVNPLHLEPVTHQENMRRGAPATKTHCNRGHEFTPENTVYNDHPKGRHRVCLSCRRENAREGWRKRNGYYEKRAESKVCADQSNNEWKWCR
jgi:hypothetical protein